MNAYERLMAEELPTGTFGHALPPPPPQRHTRPWTPEEQAQHVADLLTALQDWHDPSNQAEQKRERHLRLIKPEQTPHAA